jgi:methylated-DNA-[protein]-cysteine S-methyltransferase
MCIINKMCEGEKYLLIQKMGSPAGRIRLVASEKELAAIGWENDHPNRVRLGNIVENDSHPVLLKAEQELREYFDGKRKVFSHDLDFNDN